jgi:hypothetical protein
MGVLQIPGSGGTTSAEDVNIVPGKNCPFASSYVVLGSTKPMQIAGIGVQTEVQVRFLPAPCMKSCQFYEESSGGCCLASAAKRDQQGVVAAIAANAAMKLT